MPRPIRAPPRPRPPCVAAGCGSGFDEERETAKPLKVAHAVGESKVPGQAERPLALTDGALDAILALRDRPVAALLPGRPRARPTCAATGVRGGAAARGRAPARA